MSLLALLTSGSSPTPPGPPQPTWRNIAHGTRIGTKISGQPEGSLTTTRDLTLVYDADQVTLTYMAAKGNAPIMALGNDVTYSASINGTHVTWDGQATGLCPDGGTITSDPVTINGLAGETISVTTTATGPIVPLSQDDTLVPYRVNALTAKPSVLVIGSSSGVPRDFTAGVADGGVAVCNGSVGGSRAWSFTDDVLGGLMGLDGSHGFTHALLQVGINSNGRGVGEMCQAGVDLAWRLRSRGIGHVAAIVWKPHTTSTDGWVTVENQTPKYADRATAVAWLRAGAPVSADGLTYDLMGTAPGRLYAGQPGHPFSTVVDWSALIQSNSDPDAFRVDYGAITSDGLHINPVGYSLGKPAIQAWAESLT